MDWSIHTDHVRDDGAIDDVMVETFYRPCEGIVVVESGKYIRVIIDDEGCNTETRIAFATLDNAGFHRKAHP